MTDTTTAPAATAIPPVIMVTEELFNSRDWERGPAPVYSVDQVAKFFFGMSASWLRLKMKADKDYPATWFTNPDGTRYEFRRLVPGKDDSARVFTLADIEPMAWSLFRFGGISAVRLGMILRLVEAEAILYKLIALPDGEEDDENL